MFPIIVLLTLSFTMNVAAQSWHICSSAGGTYTANSRYHDNLELLSSTLPGNVSNNPSLFAKGSVGSAPDTVYGLALCRGDVNATACHACISKVFKGAQQWCTYKKDVTMFYPMCRLRFSNEYFLHRDDYSQIVNVDGVIDTMNTTDTSNTETMLPGWDPNNTQSVTNITMIISKLLKETAKQAVYESGGRMFATGCMKVNGTFPQLYSMAQCVPTLSHRDCSSCLEVISLLAIQSFAGKQGGRLLALWCNLRYDTAQFYSGNNASVTVQPPDVDVDVVIRASVMPKHNKRMSKLLVITLLVLLLASCFAFIISFRFIRRCTQGNASELNTKMIVKEGEELVCGPEGNNQELTIYDISQVLEATRNFSDEYKLGQGGFGSVYKGVLPHGTEIAVKRLEQDSAQGFTEFKNEVHLIAKLQHTNLVRLLGLCSQGEEKILIYEYLPNKSLDFFIFDETRRALLDWNKRLSIVDGIAHGLLYLHKHSRLRVIHRDLKASNILLDEEMNPKISDFGLAKIFSTTDIEGTTERIVGTYGYMAPEYVSEGLFSVKSDVFSFGVLILEIVSGIRASRFHRSGGCNNLLGHVWHLWKKGLWSQIMDYSIVAERHDTPKIMRCMNIALLCVQESLMDRPTMSDVTAMLSSVSMALPEPKYPAYFHVRVPKDESSIIVAEPSSPTVATE